MVTTLRPIIDSMVQSVCGRDVERLVPLAGGGMNETYRAELGSDVDVVVRIARQQVPWFIDEAHLMAQAGRAGIPTAEVLGLQHLDHDGQLLSLSIQKFLPGRSLADLIDELSASDLERLVMDAGEILARIHSLPPDERGIRHELRLPDEQQIAKIVSFVKETLDKAAAAVVRRGVEFLREHIMASPAPPVALTQGDYLPKNLLIQDGTISGVIDWEFAGSAPPAYDLARWEVSAGTPLRDRSDLLRRGYARVADPASAAAGMTSAFAIDWTLEILGWTNPASPADVQHCVDVIARHSLTR